MGARWVGLNLTNRLRDITGSHRQAESAKADFVTTSREFIPRRQPRQWDRGITAKSL